MNRKVGYSTEFWEKTVRPAMLRIKGNKCEKCQATKNLDVHHKDYQIQTIENLQLLCRKCHRHETFVVGIRKPKVKKNKKEKAL